MKKMLFFNMLFATIALPISYAGNMGPVQSEVYQPSHYFISAEGLYAWKSASTFYQNSIPVFANQNGWGGRVAAGVARPFINNLSFSAETGWGYYGRLKYVNELVGWNKSSTAYGFDLLLGASHTYQQFELFLKAGAMFENYVLVSSQNLAKQIPGNVVSGQYTFTTSQTAVVPEFKVGCIYNMNDSFGVSLAYVYVAGGKLQGNVFQTTVLGSSVLTGDANSQLPAFSAIALGLNYKF